MVIDVIRGSNQIGGSIIEVASETTRIALDVGSELGEREPIAPAVAGLFDGVATFDAVLISHYHGDHMGLLDQVVSDIPVYMGEKAYAVYKAQRRYSGKEPNGQIRTFDTSGHFTVGDIAVTPYLCDHSAFDSYMYLLETDNDSVLYTGDFRSNGRKSFDHLLQRLPIVDKLIIEGTALSGSHAIAKTEAELEEEAVQSIRAAGNAPVFVNMASTNIDRIVTFFHAAQRSGRIFLEDTYTASITAAIGGNIPNPSFSDVKVFLTRPMGRDYEILSRFPESKIGKAKIVQEKFVMMVRPSMVSYLEKLAENLDFDGGVMFYSLWEGYKEDDYTRDFLTRMETLGLRVVDLHTSGHADAEAIERLIEKTQPQEIIPVHTENAGWFERFNKGD